MRETDRYFLNLDVDLSWLHEFTPSFGWELGLHLGLRTGLSGTEGGESIGGKIRGTGGVFTGVRF